MGGTIRTGTGGWTYPPWRGLFYPKGVRQADELVYASRALTAIEINSTFQSFQTPEIFDRWAAATPEDFIFTVKAHRMCTNRKVLAEAGEAVERFVGQGLERLGDRLGPILWQLAPTKVFNPDDIDAFLALLPRSLAGRPLRHCLEARHASFADPAFTDLCRARDVAICLIDSPKFPMIEERTATFSYARLMRGEDTVETGYEPAALDAWAGRLLDLAPDHQAEKGRDVFAFFINAGKSRAPAAAMALSACIEARQAADGWT
jgi:uncharacterized protein YecE (DUF72 family)